jgi:hypothetical protein
MPFLIIASILVIIILTVYLKHPSTRGRLGENKVSLIIGETIENQQYVINNLTFVEQGKSFQIDHVVINPRGIFVIETKNYSGEIYGSENQLEWTQVLSYGKVKNKLYNPLKQNATHIYKVKKIVGKLPVRSLVVFVQNNLRHINANGVIPLSSLKTTLQSGETVLTTQQMQTAYNLLLSNKTYISKKEHIDNIRNQQRNLENGICPRCSGNLVLRNSKYGKFWGCSNYPKCKFTKKNNPSK